MKLSQPLTYWFAMLAPYLTMGLSTTTSNQEITRRQYFNPGYYPGYQPGYQSGYQPGYQPGYMGYTGQSPHYPSRGRGRRSNKKKSTPWRWQRKPNGKWARVPLKAPKYRPNSNRGSSSRHKIRYPTKPRVTNPKPNNINSSVGSGNNLTNQTITIPAPPPEPKIAYPVTCPPTQLNYEYPSWQFEEENDAGCQLAKLKLKRTFDVEMNKCSTISKGQCTEWVDGRYYQLTGVHALFNGDANEWDHLALEKEGWVLTDTPTVPSIVVMKNYLDNVSETGHVGIVESVNKDGSVCTSNWNFPTPMKVGMRNVKIEKGVSFIRYVGKGKY